MPNWAFNNITVTGDDDELDLFVEAVTVNEDGENVIRIFQSLLPCPEELYDAPSGFYTENPNPHWETLLANGDITQDWYNHLVENNAEGYKRGQENLVKFGYRDWYDWCIDNWGTKWGDTDTVLTRDEVGVHLRFDTAWTAPIDGIRRIAKLFPTLRFVSTWHEEQNIYGSAYIAHGNIFIAEDVQVDLPEYNPEEDDNYFNKVDDEVSEAKYRALALVWSLYGDLVA